MGKFIAYIMCFFVVTAHADSSFHGSLKEVFDDLAYSLTVEWDQKDPGFYQKQMNTFQKHILVMRQQGLSNAELMDFLISNVKDESAAADLKKFTEIASKQKLSRDEMDSMLKDIISRHYARGSSWIGTVLIVGGALIVAIVGAAAYMLWDASNNPADCRYDYVCNGDGTCSYTNYHCH